jgi:hypothetical protein
MHRTPLSLPEIGLIAGTRVALGAGAALLLSLGCSVEQRRAIGWTLFSVGAITTVPIVAQLISSRKEATESHGRGAAVGDQSPNMAASAI